MAYQKPIIGALSLESENCGCNFFIDGNGKGFFLYTEGEIIPGGQPPRLNPGAIQGNNVASVGDNSASVTPLANTGLPATQPIVIGVPVGVSGVQANVGSIGSGAAVSGSVDASGLALTLLGTRYDVPIV
jgi:hypothetical protein